MQFNQDRKSITNMASEQMPVNKVPFHLQSSQNRILIKGGDVVNADGTERADVYIEDR